MKSRLLYCLLFVSPPWTGGQAPSTPPQPAETIPSATYTNDQLTLSFRYPADLILRDPLKAAEAGHHVHFGQSGEKDPEHIKAMRCTNPLLVVSTTAGPENRTLIRHPPNGAPPPPDATLILAEFDRTCIPKQDKSVSLAGEASQSVLQVPGVTPIVKPLWYNIGQQEVHFAAVTGQDINAVTQQPENLILIGIATEWNGHLLLWFIEANRLYLANRLAHGLVTFGKQAPAELLPMAIGPPATQHQSPNPQQP